MQFTVCEKTSPAIKSLIEEHFVPWFDDLRGPSPEWGPYTSGLSGSIAIPLICVIDPNDSLHYLDRTLSRQSADTFYARLQSHISYQLNLGTSGTGSGSIQCGPTSCTGTSTTFPSGTQLNLTAVATPGSTFTGWTGGTCTGTGTCPVTMNQNITVTAVFAKNATQNSNTIIPPLQLLLLGN